MFGISISRFLQLQYLVLSNQNLTQKDTNKSTLAMNFYIVDVLIQFPFPHADDTGLFRRTMPQSIAITFTVISKAAKIKWIRIITSANHRGIILIPLDPVTYSQSILWDIVKSRCIALTFVPCGRAVNVKTPSTKSVCGDLAISIPNYCNSRG